MADRPILFRDDMVRAILAGRKTVTRRVGPTWARVQPGQQLWVREAWKAHALTGAGEPVQVEYRAGGTKLVARAPDDARWREDRWTPSIHMPRWACRLELEVVSVTEQRDEPVDGPSMLDVDDDEGRREGFADREGFMAAWLTMHPNFVGAVYRVEFRRLP